MTAISLADCTIHSRKDGEWETFKIVTPSTADSNDTIDLTALVNSRKLHNFLAWDISTTNGVDSVTCTYAVSTDVITIDASGGTTDSTYVITFDALHV